mmetsp:Transcript_3676/g.12971  ORF Transcript_3676/g.12971 Transcript_3676/m.12971 type:complete len:85 (+) Transcript_3676:88-342(+)|eukprot:CAMPEP_0114612988 /NCGR_PEP_ID=MMETSP0168-20121206/4902_1 /TAXON_ID=95228 ORGANISM="Vannella sp., Strain DIVA3 517/6/12" /NCGR_SAMPLE_ID=MMETSP0168 /ASSEMBLY_ACC=CAM_ASM_000044 /LENGTH=84 /DNA_ID=CAMNT_0001823983 /DNA_START=64 /DNA_END=318 /DNA_ORIENTATION=+
MSASGAAARSLYRNMMRSSRQFTDYNLRSYAVRSVRSRFRENAGVTDASKAQELLQVAKREAEILQRQSSISRMYGAPRVVVEK